MIQLKGYNQRLEKDVLLIIDDDGVILGLEKWNHIQPNSVKLFSGKCDVEGNLLFQDDEIISELNNLKMTIRYGEYQAFCPEDECEMQTVGFYAEADGYLDMPLGPTEEYARKKLEGSLG